MPDRVNLTYPTALVLQAIAAGYGHGFDVMDATGLPSGTVYPILRRLDREGLARARWETASIAHREGRPQRRYYEITAAGERLLSDASKRYRALGDIAPRARSLKPRTSPA